MIEELEYNKKLELMLAEEQLKNYQLRARVLELEERMGEMEEQETQSNSWYLEVRSDLSKSQARVRELEQWHNGHLPTCAGMDPERNQCGCGYLQGTAYRELVDRVHELEEVLYNFHLIKQGSAKALNAQCHAIYRKRHGAGPTQEVK